MDVNHDATLLSTFPMGAARLGEMNDTASSPAKGGRLCFHEPTTKLCTSLAAGRPPRMTSSIGIESGPRALPLALAKSRSSTSSREGNGKEGDDKQRRARPCTEGLGGEGRGARGGMAREGNARTGQNMARDGKARRRQCREGKDGKGVQCKEEVEARMGNRGENKEGATPTRTRNA